MQQWIEHPTDPQQLLLAWQAPTSAPAQDRLRWAVGRVQRTENGAIFDYLKDDEFKALNPGRSAADLLQAGYIGYPAFDAKRQDADGFREYVLEAFLRRLPPSNRADFGAYLAHFHIRADAVRTASDHRGETAERRIFVGRSLRPVGRSNRCRD